jgi:signal transduction histidine kinase
LLLGLTTTRLSHFTWHVTDGVRVLHTLEAGAANASSQGSLRGRYPTLELRVPAGSSRTIYARASSDTSIWLPLSAGSPLAYLQFDQTRMSRDLLIIGVFVSLVLLNGMLGSLLRQKMFYQISAVALSFAIYYSIFNGYAALCWPSCPLWIQRQGMLIVSAIGMGVFVSLNGTYALRSQRSKRVLRLQRAAEFVILFIIGSCLVLDFQVAAKLFNPLLVLAILLCLTAICLNLGRMPRGAELWFFGAWLFFGAGIVLMGLQFAAVMPTMIVNEQLQAWLLPAIFIAFFLTVVTRQRELQLEQARRDALHHAEKQAYELIGSISAGTFVVAWEQDAQGEIAMRFRFVSPQFLEMFDLVREAVMDDSDLVVQRVHPEDRSGLQEANHAAIRDESGFLWEGRVIVLEETRTYVITSTPRWESSGMLVWPGLVTDITARVEAEKRLEEALQIEQRLREEADTLRREAENAHEAKSLFLAKMSHEIRTPLSALVSLAQVMWMRSEGEEVAADFRQFLNRVRSGGHYLNLLLRNILNVSAAESGRVPVSATEFYLADWADEIRNILEPIAEYHGRSIHWGFPEDDEARCRTDQVRLTQIALNLGQNALKFGAASGVPVRILLDRREDCFHMVVEDGGPGIGGESLHAVFGEFSQAGGQVSPLDEGVGLGLSVVKINTELLGGSVTVESGRSRGARFVVVIPDLPLPPQSPRDRKGHRELACE